MTYKYKLDPSSKKFYCPNCNKKRFVKYIDETGSYLANNLGRCDRRLKCGYFNKPENDVETFVFSPAPPKPPVPPSHIKREVLEASMGQYEKNSLYLFLIKLYDEIAVQSALIRYNVGTANLWGGSTVFWQMDIQSNLRSGKIMKYDPISGNRIKKPKPLITWVHSLLKLEAFNLQQVLFGEHLLASATKDDIFCIVESEKTAIICSIEFPQFIWLATGSFQMFKKETMHNLQGRQVIVFPDTDTHNNWVQRGCEIEKSLNIQIKVSDFILNETISRDNTFGYDLADVFTEKLIDPPKRITEVQKVLKRMIKKNPALQTLIDKLDLDTENATITHDESD